MVIPGLAFSLETCRQIYKVKSDWYSNVILMILFFFGFSGCRVTSLAGIEQVH